MLRTGGAAAAAGGRVFAMVGAGEVRTGAAAEEEELVAGLAKEDVHTHRST